MTLHALLTGSLAHELVVDNFAGGGGASTGIEQALSRPIDIAINHDPEAIAMHQANHPGTRHYCESVYKVVPEEITAGRPVGLAWFSPDCKHFSKAKGGKPVEKKIRGLAWVVIRWARRIKPRVVMLENVEEFADWGPLTDDGRPCPVRRGQTFKLWVSQLERAGYRVEWRELRACDYGAPTSRKRLFVIARCDGQPIVWPTPTHGPGRLPYLTAADCIDWSIPVPSIFGRARPLAHNTERRIARGIFKYVLGAAQPFVVPLRGTSASHTSAHAVDAPLSTVTGGGTHHALCTPTLVGIDHASSGASATWRADAPLTTVTAEARHALVTAFLAKHYGGNETPGASLADPMSTITTQDHHALITADLAPAADRREQVRAFLLKFYSAGGQWQGLDEPMHTVPTHDRFGLVTVHGQQYAIADIGMRMLAPRELYRAQGFPADYAIELEHEGRALPKSAQVRMAGNSVCPPLARALVEANLLQQAAWKVAA